MSLKQCLKKINNCDSVRILIECKLNKLTNEEFKVLTTTLLSRNKIQEVEFDLTCSNLYEGDFINRCCNFIKNCDKTKLVFNFNFCKLKDQHVNMLAKDLSKNKYLRAVELILDQCEITNQGVGQLINELLICNKKLKKVKLSLNKNISVDFDPSSNECIEKQNINDDCTAIIEKAILMNHSVKYFDLSLLGNNISFNGAKKIIEATNKNKYLINFKFDPSNGFNSIGWQNNQGPFEYEKIKNLVDLQNNKRAKLQRIIKIIENILQGDTDINSNLKEDGLIDKEFEKFFIKDKNNSKEIDFKYLLEVLSKIVQKDRLAKVTYKARWYLYNVYNYFLNICIEMNKSIVQLAVIINEKLNLIYNNLLVGKAIFKDKLIEKMKNNILEKKFEIKKNIELDQTSKVYVKFKQLIEELIKIINKSKINQIQEDPKWYFHVYSCLLEYCKYLSSQLKDVYVVDITKNMSAIAYESKDSDLYLLAFQLKFEVLSNNIGFINSMDIYEKGINLSKLAVVLFILESNGWGVFKNNWTAELELKSKSKLLLTKNAFIFSKSKKIFLKNLAETGNKVNDSVDKYASNNDFVDKNVGKKIILNK